MKNNGFRFKALVDKIR